MKYLIFTILLFVFCAPRKAMDRMPDETIKKQLHEIKTMQDSLTNTLQK